MDTEAAYTLGEVRRLAGLPESFIATLVELGVLEPRDGPRFSHQDLVVLRTARALRDAEVPARKVVQALRNVKAGLASTHLASVRLRARGGAVEASAGPRRFDALSGQMLLPFDEAGPGWGVQALARPAAAAQALAEALAAEAHDDAAAEAAYRRALAQDAACALAYVNLGALLSEAGRHKEALSLYDQALVWCEASPLVHYNRAIALEDTGQPRQAAAAYERALQLDARLADAHYNLGMLLERLGDAQGSLRHFSAYRRLALP